ncbi:MAG: hypothetical protein IEMM0003_0892 [bacterium]|nr:MAG: hypothetical protein IEMM0003_0892 [bacterium]
MKSNELKAAYLFENADILTAKRIIADLSCERSDGHAIFDNIKGGCGECRTCKMISNDLYSNMYIVTSDKAIGIDEIRTVTKFLSFKSVKGRKNFVVIDCSNGITDPAQNATLKLLEEPPELSHFFITGIKRTELLPTVLSRVIVINHKFNKQIGADKKFESLLLNGNYEGLISHVKKLKRKDIADNLIKIAENNRSSKIFDKLMDSAINIVNYNCNQKIILYGLIREQNEKNR